MHGRVVRPTTGSSSAFLKELLVPIDSTKDCDLEKLNRRKDLRTLYLVLVSDPSFDPRLAAWLSAARTSAPNFSLSASYFSIRWSTGCSVAIAWLAILRILSVRWDARHIPCNEEIEEDENVCH